MNDAGVSLGVPVVHGVNRLAELGHVSLVDTTSIEPDESGTHCTRCLAELYKLGQTSGLVVVLAQAPGRRRERHPDGSDRWPSNDAGKRRF